MAGKYKRPAKMSAARRRMRYTLRRAALGAIIAGILLAIFFGDRAGIFGLAPVSDLAKYDGQSFRVVRVIDGDTIDIAIPDGKYPNTRIRLWGVDTPETVKANTPVQHFGPEASDFTRSQVAGKIVSLQLEHNQTRDKHDRLLAYVILPDGQMLNRMLVASGYGYADPRYEHTHKANFRRLERAAIKAGRGLWADVTPAEMPYYHREKTRRER